MQSKNLVFPGWLIDRIPQRRRYVGKLTDAPTNDTITTGYKAVLSSRIQAENPAAAVEPDDSRIKQFQNSV